MRWIVGLDEVGRGSLAGPVVVCAVAIPKGLQVLESKIGSNGRKLGKVRDSKKLTKKQREEWFKYLKNNPALCYSIATVSPKRIDRLNISGAANLAAWRAFKKLSRASRFMFHDLDICLDGGLHLKKKGFVSQARTVIRGDQKIPAISMASIIAKVYRDELMSKIAKKYPGYGLEIHKGYGTRAHYKAIRKLGPSQIHRLTFIKE